jgi:hypothetical protein
MTATQKPWNLGPFRRVLLSAALAAKHKDALLYATDCVFVNSELGDAVEMRVGWIGGGAGTLGSVGAHYGQCIHEHVRADGTLDRIIFGGGRMYRWDGTDPPLGLTDITPGTVTISTTARIFCVSFADRIIVNDGVNQPWSYDPAAATTALIGYDTAGGGTAWTAYGQPVVFGAKLFFILNTVGGTSFLNSFIWSEETDPSIGYRQTGGLQTYTNIWTFTQTDGHRLYALVSTNEALYIFRRDSITAVRGLVNSSFVSSANSEAFPFGIGTTTPVLRYGDYIWFFNAQGRPCRLSVSGGKPEQLWEQHTDELPTSLQTPFDAAISYCPDRRLVVMAIWAAGSGSTHSAQMHVFSADEGLYQGDWYLCSTFAFSTLGVCSNSVGIPCLMALGTAEATGGTPAAAKQGAFYRMKVFAEASPYRDTVDSVASTIAASAWTHLIPSGSHGTFVFDQARLRVRAPASGSVAYTLHTATPYSTLYLIQSATASRASTNMAAPNATAESYADFGLGVNARWLQLRVIAPPSTTAQTSPLSLLGIEVTVTPAGDSSRTP